MKVGIFLFLCLFILGCTSNVIPTNKIPTDSIDDVTNILSCQTDADCVPANCCHSKSCVSKENAPDCADIMCSLNCEIGTTDCGGGCYCDEGKCAAILYGENGSLTKSKWR